MRIAIISDTHNNKDKVNDFLDILKKEGITTIIHAGDLVSPEMIGLFKGFDLRIVFGNCDHDREGMVCMCKEYGFDKPEDIIELSIDSKRIAVAHEPYKIEEFLQSGKYDYVIHGHTHRAKEEMIGKTVLLNPGAFFRAPYYTYVVLDLDSGDLDFFEI